MMESDKSHGHVLWCSGLRKEFGELVAVNDLGFHIAPGETYGLLGPNGAGKTTAISMIAGLIEGDGGEVQVLGRSMDRDAREVKRHIGYVPQDLAVYPDLTARENLRFFGHLYKMRGAQLDRRVDQVLETVQLTDRADDRVEKYSGGMKRRINIGIGLLHEPTLLILDEPTVGVDPQSRDAILSSVEQLGAAGLAVLYTTHYMEEAQRLCHRVGIIDHGEMKAEGTHAELARLVGERDHLHLQASGRLPAAASAVAGVSGVVEAAVSSSGLDLVVENAGDLLPKILQTTFDSGVSVSGVDIRTADLEMVFLHLTGRALRE
jgi:ABC-2 type transport system ATP-binding protein